MSERIESLIEVPELHYDVTGSDFDVATMLTGIPEYWSRLETETEQAPQETLRLTVNMAFLGGVSTRTVETRGAAVAALIQCLEFVNKRVEVNVILTSSADMGRGEMSSQTIRVKDAEQPLDLDRLAFAVMHASSFRRLGFAIRETDASFMRSTFSYGFATNPKVLPEGIYVPVVQDGSFDNTTEGAIKWVIARLKEQGVTVNE
jgi:hypothetical protein